MLSTVNIHEADIVNSINIKITSPAMNSVPASSAVAKKSSKALCSVMDCRLGPASLSTSLLCS